MKVFVTSFFVSLVESHSAAPRRIQEQLEQLLRGLLCQRSDFALRSVIVVASFQRKTLLWRSGALRLLLLIRNVTSIPYVENLLVDCVEGSLACEVVAVKLECSMGMACVELNDRILEQLSGIADVVLEPWWHSRVQAVILVKKPGSTWLELMAI